MRRTRRIATALLLVTLVGCASAPISADHHSEHRESIKQVLRSFAQAIAAKDKPLYMSLFFSQRPEEIGWQYVSEDVRLAMIRRAKPDAIKARRIPGNNFVALIDEAVGTRASREEKFSNVQIDTDGDIASVLFDYEFYAAGKRTNWGKEHWQLVRTETGWKIFSVVYTIRDEMSSGD